jgi:hypothetical protein
VRSGHGKSTLSNSSVHRIHAASPKQTLSILGSDLDLRTHNELIEWALTLVARLLRTSFALTRKVKEGHREITKVEQTRFNSVALLEML